MLPVAIYKTVTITSGQTTSGEASAELISNGSYQLHAVELPAAMTGTSFTFTGARSSGGTFVTLREVGGAASYTAQFAASTGVHLDPRVFATWPYVKLVSSAAEGADRSIVLHFRRID